MLEMFFIGMRRHEYFYFDYIINFLVESLIDVRYTYIVVSYVVSVVWIVCAVYR